jgi:hypothetical protein
VRPTSDYIFDDMVRVAFPYDSSNLDKVLTWSGQHGPLAYRDEASRAGWVLTVGRLGEYNF